ncbi:inhibitor of growth protein 1-like [Asterias rubens]|uniref:inhibitor of growth protein 1-like n=1 Tax=Asterias rubens TaxID=7604 RepID=UPI0014556903|nr:inhibitor of growth protein 1-like [Asterias rubens]
MTNQTSMDTAKSTAYVEDYLDCIESLPNDLQRNVSQMREVDSLYQSVLKEIQQHYKTLGDKDLDGNSRRRCLVQMQCALVRSQELGDEKLHLASQIVELTENRLRQMETNSESLIIRERVEQRTQETSKVNIKSSYTKPGYVKPGYNKPGYNKQGYNKPGYGKPGYGKPGYGKVAAYNKVAKKVVENNQEKAMKRPRRQRNHDNGKEKEIEVPTNEVAKPAKKKKRSKVNKAERVASPVEPPIDPNEPTYCLCNQVSYGEMVGCDNKDCPFEWFHFGCVGLTLKPKGRWYCPRCRPAQEAKKK